MGVISSVTGIMAIPTPLVENNSAGPTPLYLAGVSSSQPGSIDHTLPLANMVSLFVSVLSAGLVGGTMPKDPQLRVSGGDSPDDKDPIGCALAKGVGKASIVAGLGLTGSNLATGHTGWALGTGSYFFVKSYVIDRFIIPKKCGDDFDGGGGRRLLDSLREWLNKQIEVPRLAPQPAPVHRPTRYVPHLESGAVEGDEIGNWLPLVIATGFAGLARGGFELSASYLSRVASTTVTPAAARTTPWLMRAVMQMIVL